MLYLVKDPFTDDLTIWKDVSEDAPGVIEFVQTIDKGGLVPIFSKPLSSLNITTIMNVSRNIIAQDNDLNCLITLAAIDKL